MAEQVEPVKPMLKASGTKRLKKCYYLVSNVPCNFNLRQYNTASLMGAINMDGGDSGAVGGLPDGEDGGRAFHSSTSRLHLLRFCHWNR